MSETAATVKGMEYIDVPIPETGWERVAVDPERDSRAWGIDSLIGAIAPAPDWLYEINTLARFHDNSPMRMHPAEYYRMTRSSWASGNMPPLQHGDHGTEVIIDPDIPEGIVRITKRKQAGAWMR